jgi:hypothetical protein
MGNIDLVDCVLVFAVAHTYDTGDTPTLYILSLTYDAGSIEENI